MAWISRKANKKRSGGVCLWTIYELRLYDEPLLSFVFTDGNSAGCISKIKSVVDEHSTLLPLVLELTGESERMGIIQGFILKRYVELNKKHWKC